MRVAVVEDHPINLRMLTGVLGGLDGVAAEGFTDPCAALARADEGFDLWLVDYQMPGMDGLELIHRLRALRATRDVPIVMITADNQRALRLAAIRAGATDFLAKPVDPEELKVRAVNLLTLRRAQTRLADRAALLADEVAAATRRLIEREEELVTRLARAIELRDGQTGDHILRVSEVSRLIAAELGLPAEDCRNIALAARLHDAGKLGVPDAILLKRGKLTEGEYAQMRGHTLIGSRILADGATDLIRLAHDIALCHHERWDGAGYPQGLAGDRIPLPARIAAVADVLDALRSTRPYKDGWPAEAARAEILAQSGRAFDPACVAALMRVWARTLPLYDDRPRAASSFEAALETLPETLPETTACPSPDAV